MSIMFHVYNHSIPAQSSNVITDFIADLAVQV